MSPATANHQKARSRVSNACQRCRKHKIKCSGDNPCRTCDNKGYRCIYLADDKKIVISESTLHELQKRAQELEQLQSHRADQAVTQVSPTPSNDVFASGPVEAEISHVPSHQYSTSFPHNNDAEGDASTDGEDPLHEELATTLSNPLVPEQPGYLHDSGGGLRYLGHSSTWSFAQQLLFKAHQSPHVASASHPTVTYEASVYNVDVSKYILVPEDFLNLPSYELAVYYAQTVRFRTHPLYHLFDDDDFRSSLSHFYGNMQQFAQQYRIWFVHYLILMAFGKVFTTQRNAVVAGTTLFNRALRLLPDVTFLSRDPIASTELLCCFALYLQSIDYRAAAYVHMGQALRMALSHGLHTGMQTVTVATDLAARGCRIWWTVYTLDRRLASSFGAPSGLRDEDMTAPLLSVVDSPDTASGHNIHVRICRLLGRVISTIYSSEETFKRAFLSTVQEVLRGAASLIDELARYSEQCAGEISPVAAHLKLSYHQCIIYASRPLLFHLLSRHLESAGPPQPPRLSSAVKGILQVCIDSAIQTTGILGQLQEHELLDNFLPFDLESAYSAALVLVIASAVYPKLIPSNDWLEACIKIFDYMADKGNALASIRKSEIEQLGRVRIPVQTTHLGRDAGQQSTMQMQQGSTRGGPPAAQPTPAATSSTDESQPSLPSLAPFFDEWLTDVGFSEVQMMELANSLNPQDMTF